MKKTIATYATLLLLAGIINSCKNPCAGVIAKHYYIEIHKESAVTGPVFYSNVYGVGNGVSILPYYTDNNVDKYKVYLNLHDTNVSFVFENSTRRDTLKYHYTHYLHFVGDECGYVDDINVKSQTTYNMKIVGYSYYYPSTGVYSGLNDSVICVQVP